MLQLNELRLNNWVNDPVHNKCDIQLNKDTFSAFLDDYKDELIGIPISEDWLVNRFQFKKVKCNEFWDFYQLENGYYIGLSKHNEPSAGVKEGFWYAGDNYYQLDFIHDLQNHYYYNHFKKELELKT